MEIGLGKKVSATLSLAETPEMLLPAVLCVRKRLPYIRKAPIHDNLDVGSCHILKFASLDVLRLGLYCQPSSAWDLSVFSLRFDPKTQVTLCHRRSNNTHWRYFHFVISTPRRLKMANCSLARTRKVLICVKLMTIVIKVICHREGKRSK